MEVSVADHAIRQAVKDNLTWSARKSVSMLDQSASVEKRCLMLMRAVKLTFVSSEHGLTC